MASPSDPISSDNFVSVLPNLSADIIRDLLAKLNDVLGVDAIQDLRHVKETELVPPLKPIQARKLMESWSKIETETLMPVTSQPVEGNRVEVSPASGLVSPSGRLLVDFQLPWNKMPPALLMALKNHEPPKPSLRREMVRIVCADVHVISSNPGRKQLRLLAERIVNTYPESLRDRVGDGVVGSGHDSLFFQMEERLHNMNRGNNSVRKRLCDRQEEESASSTGVKKSCFRDRYGCVSWQPQVGAGEEELLREKQSALKTLALSVDPEKKSIVDLMADTYCLQRVDINSGLNAQVLKEMWPFLFTEIGIMTHVKLLTEIDLESVMMVAFSQKAPTVISFFKSQSKRVANVCQRLDEAKEELKNETPIFIGVLLLLLAYFNETEDSLIVVKDVAAAVPDELGGLPATPCLIVFGTSAMTGSRFCLCVNGVVVCDNINNPSTAVAMLFGVFYVLNLHYPDGASITLEFIQRCFCGINPERGTKAAKHHGRKTHSIHPKILTLTNALRDFTNQWAL